MSYDFKALHTAIKAVIDAADFEYVQLGDWGDFQDRHFPSGLKNKGYAIMFPGMGAAANSGLASAADVGVTVEFFMDVQNDLYLDVLDNAVTAIKSLKDVDASTLCGVVDDGGLTDFTSIFIPKGETALGAMVVQFANIRVEIEV